MALNPAPLSHEQRTMAFITVFDMAARVVPLHCIIPPHMLREIAQRGDSDQQAWAFHTLSLSEQLRGQRQALGLFALATPAGAKRRTIYDARRGEDLPGALVREEGDPKSKDRAVNEAYDGAGATYDVFMKVFDRNSVDDRGLRLDATVHYGRAYDNAFWDGRQMVYGDGDGRFFTRFTKAIDVIGHELTHGVTQYEAGLAYRGQSGALNESFSDVFGALVKQWKLKQKAERADWLIGKALLTAKVNGTAIRSMKAPGTAYDDPVLGKDPQPGHMRRYQNVAYDNGGVHINSGIPNRAFYLAAMEIGGHAWDKAGRIWYIALKDRLRRTATFHKAAEITVRVAGDLYGKGSKEQKAVRNGWKAVGLTVK